MWEQKYGDPIYIYTKTIPRAQFRQDKLCLMNDDNHENPKFMYAIHVHTEIYTVYIVYTICYVYMLFAYLCMWHSTFDGFFSRPKKRQAFAPLGRIQDPGGMMWEMNDMLTKSTWATKRLKRRWNADVRWCSPKWCEKTLTSLRPWSWLDPVLHIVATMESPAVPLRFNITGTAETNSMIDSKWRHEVAWYIFQMYQISNNYNYVYIYI